MDFNKLDESIDYVLDLLESNGYELSTENVLALCENIENNNTYVLLGAGMALNEWSDPDFYYMQILENNGFEITENNVNVLKEAINNGSILLEDPGEDSVDEHHIVTPGSDDKDNKAKQSLESPTDDKELVSDANVGNVAAHNARTREAFRDASKESRKRQTKGTLIGAGVGAAAAAGAGAGITAGISRHATGAINTTATKGVAQGLGIGGAIAGSIIGNRIAKKIQERKEEKDYNQAIIDANKKGATEEEKAQARAKAAALRARGADDRQLNYMKSVKKKTGATEEDGRGGLPGEQSNK